MKNILGMFVLYISAQYLVQNKVKKELFFVFKFS